MGPDGNLRRLEANEQAKPDEIVVPPAELPEVQKMTRQQRRAWYRKQAKAAGRKRRNRG